MILSIDYDLCEGCEACAGAYPELFEMRGGQAWVIAEGDVDGDKYKDVEAVCPFRAISTGKEDGHVFGARRSHRRR